MSQSIEIEFKNLLTKNEYEQLLHSLSYEQMTFQHKNHYFDTEHYTLQNNRVALRIRETDSQFILTLKEPVTVGSLETTEIIDQAMADNWINNNAQFTPTIAKQLNLYNITAETLKYYGFLKTHRTLYKVNDEIVIALDHSFYHHLDDYELEVEGSTESETKQFFQSLLKDYNIKNKYTTPKIQRFFAHL